MRDGLAGPEPDESAMAHDAAAEPPVGEGPTGRAAAESGLEDGAALGRAAGEGDGPGEGAVAEGGVRADTAAEPAPGHGAAAEEAGQARPVSDQARTVPAPEAVVERVGSGPTADHERDDGGQVEPAVAGTGAVESAPVEHDSAAGEPTVEQTARRSPDGAPELPDDIQFSDLDPEARRELRGLAKSVAELVGRHLVAAGQLIDDDPELALRHARFARSRAARVALVREAAGLTAYHAGEWAEALGELRAARRMSGEQLHLPVMADCERALGRPERALELATEARDLPKHVAVELRIVAAGARRDMGQLDAAVVALQGPDLDPAVREPWSPRLFYAYADNLEAAGRTEDAIRWFLNAAEADLDEETDAAERAFALREAE